MEAVAGALVGFMTAVALTAIPPRWWPATAPGWVRVVLSVSSTLVAGVVAWRVDLGLSWWAFVVFGAVVPFLIAIDVAVQRLPFMLTVPIGVIGLALFAIETVATESSPAGVARAIGAALVVGAYFATVGLVSRDGMGGGDVVLAGVVALYLGWIGWATVFVGLLSGLVAAGVAGGALAMVHGGSVRTRFALGPFLLAGWATGILIG